MGLGVRWGKWFSERDQKTRKDDLFAHPQHSKHKVQTVPALKLNRATTVYLSGCSLGATNCNLWQLKGLKCDRSLGCCSEIDKTAGNSLQSRLYPDPNNSCYLGIYTKLTLTTVEELLSCFMG